MFRKLLIGIVLLVLIGQFFGGGGGSGSDTQLQREPAIPLDDAFILTAVALGRSGTTGCGDFTLHRLSERRFEARCYDGRSHTVNFPQTIRTPVAELNGRRVELR